MNNGNGATLLALTGIRKEFGTGRRSVVAVADATLTLARGECLVLVGPSGSGKTTLLTMAAGFTMPTRGELLLFDKAVEHYDACDLQRTRAQRIGFVFQTFRLLEPLSVLENLILAATFAGCGRRESHARAVEILHDLEVGHLSSSYPGELSQGEKQRVGAARALINRPDLLIADEPTASLESSQAQALVVCLAEYVKAANAALLVATHDLRLLSIADRVLRIEDGVLTSAAVPASNLTRTPPSASGENAAQATVVQPE
jgi:putative ABC transport system ATP-binding protein